MFSFLRASPGFVSTSQLRTVASLSLSHQEEYRRFDCAKITVLYYICICLRLSLSFLHSCPSSFAAVLDAAHVVVVVVVVVYH